MLVIASMWAVVSPKVALKAIQAQLPASTESPLITNLDPTHSRSNVVAILCLVTGAVYHPDFIVKVASNAIVALDGLHSNVSLDASKMAILRYIFNLFNRTFYIKTF